MLFNIFINDLLSKYQIVEIGAKVNSDYIICIGRRGKQAKLFNK